mgnify:CR=1 FL=1
MYKILNMFIAEINGESMLPYLSSGTKCLCEKKNKNMIIKENDIIVFKKDNHLIIHRVKSKVSFGKNHFYYETQGDNNPVKDPFVVFESEIAGIFVRKMI